ncbi:MAG: dienelactone hydrolase family protein [Rhizobiaceae bacterium]
MTLWCARYIIAIWVALFLAPYANAAERVSFPASAKWRGKAVEIGGEFSRPGGSKKVPAVILMHGCGGLGSAVRASLRTHARYLVRNGFAVLILDSFGPRRIAGGWVCKGLDRLADARNYRLADARDASKWLLTRSDIDGRNIFIMGQSNGGSVALRAAAAGGFRAAAAYYPWCGAASANRAPLIVFGGGLDDWVPPKTCRNRPQSARYQYVHYDDAAHSFDVRSLQNSYLGYRLGYNSAATKDSRARMITFFRKHMR